jgi:NDP-sugar pyrophosphorylase family protein
MRKRRIETLTRRIKIGVIPAAGKGKRLGYLGFVLPKCLFVVYDKPILHHILDIMKGLGVEEVYIVVNYQAEKIKEYIKNANQINNGLDSLKIFFVRQKELTGIADSILCLQDSISEDFITILGDDYTISDSLDNLVKTFFSNSAYALQGFVEEKNTDVLKSTCSIRLGENNRIVEIVEKPAIPSTNIRGCGIYLFSQAIFDFARKTPVSLPRNEREISNTINLIAKQGAAYGEKINGTNFNINTFDDLLKASIYAAENGKRLRIQPLTH